MMFNKLIFSLGWALGLFLNQVMATPQATPKSLTLGFLPYITASEIMKKYTPLATYLGQQVGIPVILKISKNYEEHIQYVGEDRLDLAFLGGAPYIHMVEKYGSKPLLARYEIQGKPTFHGIIIVPKNSPLKEIRELSGQRFAFGDPGSTLSSLVPRYMLQEAGVPLDKLASYDFLKSQPNVVFGVLLGNYTAGSVALEVFEEYEARGLRILAKSPEISTHLFVTRSTLLPELLNKLRTAFYELKTHPDGKSILSHIGKDITGFSLVNDEDYDGLRTILKALPPLKN